MKTKDGGPAFPNQTCDEESVGMSLRDYFAGQAMQSLLMLGSTPSRPSPDDIQKEPDQPWYFGNWEPHDEYDGVNWLAMHSYEVADAMLKWRDREVDE
jgi:hypothetical protein